MMNDSISVNITRRENSILLESQEDRIEISGNYINNQNAVLSDFAAWFFLPIAMKQNRPLHINGNGRPKTILNAIKISEIWESWLPHHFSTVEVSFDNIIDSDKEAAGELYLFSGGVDSTHAITRRQLVEGTKDFLTIHGMDYSTDDEKKFDDFKTKTRPFSEKFCNKHFYIKTNAYQIYNKHGINLKSSHITHIFTLAGCSFLFSENYKSIYIAADYRTDQQMITHPWGSNSITNRFFDDGLTKLVTLDDDLSRTEKMPLLMNTPEALQSLTFCVDKKSRPSNCGVCSKCVRTKLMFFAATGKIPDIFLHAEIPEEWYKVFNLNAGSQRAFILDILATAKRNGIIGDIPGSEIAYAKIKAQKTGLGSRLKKIIKGS